MLGVGKFWWFLLWWLCRGSCLWLAHTGLNRGREGEGSRQVTIHLLVLERRKKKRELQNCPVKLTIHPANCVPRNSLFLSQRAHILADVYKRA